MMKVIYQLLDLFSHQHDLIYTIFVKQLDLDDLKKKKKSDANLDKDNVEETKLNETIESIIL